MFRRILTTLSLLAIIGLSGCAPADPLVGIWRQTGTVGGDGVEHSVPTSEAAVLEMRPGGGATVVQSQADAKGAAFTWKVDRGLLMLGDHPGWDLRTVYELEYELKGDRLTTNWIDGPPRRVFERQ
jgi:hypothetical protein